MTYETYIFTPNPDRNRNQLLALLFTGLWVLAIVVSNLFEVTGILVFGTFIMVITYLKAKLPFDVAEKVSEGRLGNLPEDKLILSDTSITFSNRKVASWELKNVLVYADDYIGKPKGIFGDSHGTGNKIEFELDNKKHSIQFLVRKRSELKIINDIALSIEAQTQQP